MRKALLTGIALAAMTVAGATSAQASGVYFGVGSGPYYGSYYDDDYYHHHHPYWRARYGDNDWYWRHHYWRHHHWYRHRDWDRDRDNYWRYHDRY